MAISNELNQLTVKELASIAKELAIVGWHEMRKEELVRALANKSRSKNAGELLRKRLSAQSKRPKTVASPTKAGSKGGTTKTASGAKKTSSGPKKPAPPVSPPASTAKPVVSRVDIALPTTTSGQSRLALIVRDPYWLQAYWEVDTKTVDRAKVALGYAWHSAVPILRLFRLESDGVANPRRRFLRDIHVHGGVDNWYIDVSDPPSTFQLELGFLSRDSKFFPIASSNNVVTPQRQIHDDVDRLDGNWRGIAPDLDRIFTLSGGLEGHNRELREVFEKNLNRSMSTPLLSRFRAAQQGAGGEKTRRNFDFRVDADLVIHGKTDPSVQVSIRGVPIKVGADGVFAVRFALPEKRHVFPIDAEGSDGVETQRVILAVERNTKVLETVFQEHDEED